MFKSKFNSHPDYVFISCVVILTVFGLIMLSSASSDLGKMEFNDTYYYLKHQMLYGLSFGIIGFLFASFINYRFWKKIAVLLLLVSLFLLVLVFTSLGSPVGNVHRWLNIGPLSFQPAEFLKFTFIIYLAAWLSSKKSKGLGRQKSVLAGYLPFLIVSGLVAFLIIKQPSTGTMAIIMVAGLLVYFASGARLSFVFGTIILALLGLLLIISVSGNSNDYRLIRIQTYLKTFLEPEAVNYQNQGYQINQALMSIGSGGLFGVGFGQSIIKFRSLPEPLNDSIFAVIAQELGFVGTVFLIGIFILLFVRGLNIAKNSPDQFAKLTVVGFTSIIAIQAFMNVAAISGVIPLTGVPLPFIGYGGTALAVFLTMAGVVGNISKYTS